MRPLPRYVLAIMAGFVVFELWIPLLAIILRALVGPTIPTAVQAIVPLFGLAVPTAVALGLSDYLADRQGLVRPYQPKRRGAGSEQDLAEDEDDEEDEWAEDDEDEWAEAEDDEDEWAEHEDVIGQERPAGDTEYADERHDPEAAAWRRPGTVEDQDTAGQERSSRDPAGGPERRDPEVGDDRAAGARRPSGGQRPSDDPGRPGR